MSETLTLLRYEQDEDGHQVGVYRSNDGSIHRVVTMPTLDYLNHQAAVLGATVRVLQQRTAKEMAEFELEEARSFMRERSQQKQMGLKLVGSSTAVRALPAPGKY
jgi:stress response protein SCP2